MADMAEPIRKSDQAFRTIGELAADLGVPQHILRYWETRFPQLKPLQRAGNRRYYRPDDVALARRIHRLLNQDGYTIRGVQQLLARAAARRRGARPRPPRRAPTPANQHDPFPPSNCARCGRLWPTHLRRRTSEHRATPHLALAALGAASPRRARRTPRSRRTASCARCAATCWNMDAAGC